MGLSWLSPLGPLSINFARPVKKEDKDNTEIFMLSFGTQFLMRGAARAVGRSGAVIGLVLPAATRRRPRDKLPPTVAAVIDYQQILRDPEPREPSATRLRAGGGCIRSR